MVDHWHACQAWTASSLVVHYAALARGIGVQKDRKSLLERVAMTQNSIIQHVTPADREHYSPPLDSRQSDLPSFLHTPVVNSPASPTPLVSKSQPPTSLPDDSALVLPHCSSSQNARIAAWCWMKTLQSVLQARVMEEAEERAS